ncbi:MAG: 7-carboxy-7-deazaguanine synthase [Acidocella sp. 20-58-15]|nr:MAG: 7-carboxy-7-deazaguanine synthase [Acidocella sp. 20-58-15]
MTYNVKEIFYTLQGEGRNVGRAAIFCRFTGCNLWSGREMDRNTAVCRFCDTDFVGIDGTGGGRFATADQLAIAIDAVRPTGTKVELVVLTGGEPMLQIDDALIDALHNLGFKIAVETNGTIPVPAEIDWLCVSPKAGTQLAISQGDELKLVFPQPNAGPECFESLAFTDFLLQPMDGPDQTDNTAAAVSYCLAHPRWRLSLQTHKLLGLR